MSVGVPPEIIAPTPTVYKSAQVDILFCNSEDNLSGANCTEPFIGYAYKHIAQFYVFCSGHNCCCLESSARVARAINMASWAISSAANGIISPLLHSPCIAAIVKALRSVWLIEGVNPSKSTGALPAN